MSRDFFLLNRCFQVAKICRPTGSANFSYPPLKSRSKLPPQLQKLYELLDRICAIANVDGMQTADADLQNVPIDLDQHQRSDLEEFERLVVALRFSSDDSIKSPAVTLLRAIFADAHYFSGLKPLPQYTEAFAYELLFPSWLNLLSATMLPRATDAKPRLEGSRQGVLFEFLGDFDQLPAEQHLRLVGYMTFIASRFDAPACEDFLQRVVDLLLHQGAGTVEALDDLDLACKDARQFKRAIADYLVVMSSLADGTTSSYAIAYQRPARRTLPEVVAVPLQGHAESGRWHEFLSLAGPLRAIIESKHSLAPEMVNQLAAHRESLDQLLGLVAVESPPQRYVLSAQAQSAVAALIASQSIPLHEQLTGLQTFCRDIAPQLDGFSEDTLDYFHRILIIDDAGRQQLLAGLRAPASRSALVEQLQRRAAESDDASRWLSLLSCASILWPSSDSSEARAALLGIEAVISNRTIGDKELSDLLTDLRAAPLQALERLASPMMAAAGKSPRVAALYLTLNEVSQKLSSTGAVDNFSVVRAKYSRLTNMELD